MHLIDFHDRVLPGEGRHVTLVGDLIEFHASGGGPQDHEIFYHAAVFELVLDVVHVVWASLFVEPL
jgi:hypothetical protein